MPKIIAKTKMMNTMRIIKFNGYEVVLLSSVVVVSAQVTPKYSSVQVAQNKLLRQKSSIKPMDW